MSLATPEWFDIGHLYAAHINAFEQYIIGFYISTVRDTDRECK